MSGQKTPSTTTQVTKQERPGYIDRAFQSQYLPGLTAAYERPFQPYTGQRISDLNPSIQAGMQMTQARALNGSPLVGAANRNLTGVLNGDYLDPSKNPAWAGISGGITDAYKMGTAAQTDRSFAQNRAFGGSAHNEMMQRNNATLAGSLANAAGDLYNTERGYQMQAAQMAPGLADQDYRDAEALFGVGDIQRNYEQDLLNQNMQDYNDRMNYPVSQLDMLGRGLSTAMTGTQSQTATAPNPYRPNTAAGTLGGALAGAGAGAKAGGTTYGGYGALIGGLLGAGAGYYGSR
jgi:hypothetical protein